MKKLASLVLLAGALAAVFTVLTVERADAFPQFAKEFENKYIGDESTDVQKALAAEVKDVKKCNVCHDPRKGADGKVSKKNRNPYGEALGKLLTKDDKKDVEKIMKALAEVESLKAEGAESTYGELLNMGKVPFRY